MRTDGRGRARAGEGGRRRATTADGGGRRSIRGNNGRRRLSSPVVACDRLFTGAAVALVLVASGCTRDQWQRFPSPDDAVAAVPWFSVMKRSIAIEPYRIAHSGPVPGTVPITGHEVVLPAIPANEATLNRLVNPVQRTAASLERGRDRYGIYCLVCHGPEGLGNGPVAPALANAVRNLSEPRMRARSDGWIYAVIANGFGALMPEYRSKIAPEDRWHIVNYVRVLQGTAAVTP